MATHICVLISNSQRVDEFFSVRCLSGWILLISLSFLDSICNRQKRGQMISLSLSLSRLFLNTSLFIFVLSHFLHFQTHRQKRFSACGYFLSLSLSVTGIRFFVFCCHSLTFPISQSRLFRFLAAVCVCWGFFTFFLPLGWIREMCGGVCWVFSSF